MADASEIAVADALVAQLNAAPAWSGAPAAWPMLFKAERHYVAYYDRAEDVDEPRVAVVPASLEEEPAGRDRVAEDIALLVGVQMAVDSENKPLLDRLMSLCQAIRDSVRLQGIGPAAWLKTTVPQLFAPERLTTLQQFTSVMQFTLRNFR